MSLTVGQTPSTTTTAAKTLPPSIQSDLDSFGKKDVKEIHPSLLIHSAECTHAPAEGKVSGLDLDELKVIGEVAPEKMEAYERMRKSKANQENLRADMKQATSSLNRAQEEYDSAAKELKGNWFTNMFRSKETKAEQQARFDRAASALKRVEQSYNLESKNVISYQTILERNGGAEF